MRGWFEKVSLTIWRTRGSGASLEDMSLAGVVEPAFHQTSGSVRVTLSGIPVDAHLESRLPRRARDLLVIVRQQDHPITRDVMDASGLSRPLVSRTLQALEKEGLVERVGSSPKDPRAYWRVRTIEGNCTQLKIL